MLEPTWEELCGGQETGHSKGKTKSRFPAKLTEIERFGGQMEIILANLKGELHKGPFLKHLLNQANAWTNPNEF